MLRFQSVFDTFLHVVELTAASQRYSLNQPIAESYWLTVSYRPLLGVRTPPHPAWHNGRLQGKLRPLFYAFGESAASMACEESQKYFRNPSVVEFPQAMQRTERPAAGDSALGSVLTVAQGRHAYNLSSARICSRPCPWAEAS
jgi:hypothetical protein